MGVNFVQKMLDPKERTVEIHHVTGLGTMVAHWFLAIWQTIHGVAVDLTSFGAGAAAIIGAVSAAGWGAGKQRASDPACQEKPPVVAVDQEIG